MRLVVHASTLVAELLRARGRELLAHPGLDLVATTEAWNETQHELRKRVRLLVDRGHLEATPATQLMDEALATVAARVTLVPAEVYADQLEEARGRVPRDLRDAPTVALALSLDCGIWTGDYDFFSFLPPEDGGRVSASTVHRYKGLERPAVIVLDAVEGSYPLIHPGWLFLRVFGDSLDRLEEEERRLFYVALTRARDSLALITDSRRQSPYLNDIQRHLPLTGGAWTDLSSAPSLDGARLEVRVYNAYEGFSFEALLDPPWAGHQVKIAAIHGPYPPAKPRPRAAPISPISGSGLHSAQLTAYASTKKATS